MARNWDARVRGASQKATTPHESSSEGDDTAEATDGRASGRRNRSDRAAAAPLPGLRALSEAQTFDFLDDSRSDESQTEAAEKKVSAPEPVIESEAPDDQVEKFTAEARPKGPTTSRGRSLAATLGTISSVEASAKRARDAELIADGLSMAVKAAGLSVAVVERSTGLIHWTSDQWVDRFGEKDTIARHMPTATEFGESPLPPPGESWQRTRTLLYADGSEHLADLLLVGHTATSGADIVSVVALDSSGNGLLITERAQVISVIDGAVEQVADGAVAVLYVDLDRFKVVHDLVGNIEALRVLDLVNHRIASTVRGSDLLFRLHSDEFVVVACELEHAGAAEDLAERIRASIATLTDVGQELAITASVGVVLAEANQTGDKLLSAAETAVYVAKGRGRNRVALHDEELRTRTQRLMVVERQLRQAIDRKDVRFAYQPVVDIVSGRVTGAEALLRLGGDVGLSAVEVVAAAEHSGLMGALGVLVLEGVNEQLGTFLRTPGGDEVIMINLSATQLADEDLIRSLEAFSADGSLANRRLALEVPELVVRDHRKAVARLADLVRPKFQVGIDGFGTGLLKDDVLDWLPLDYIKLHRSVTTSLVNAGDDEKQRLHRLVARAREAGIQVAALGVEDEEQAAALSNLGCEWAQGFLYAGAVTSENLLGLVETGLARPTDSA